MPTLVYPNSATIKEIAQVKLPELQAADPIFELFPDVTEDASILMWEQMDDYTGMQQVRGLNGAPPVVARVGLNQFLMKPGVYGEHQPIDEMQMTERRKYGTFGEPIDVSDLVLKSQEQLLHREVVRKKFLCWQLVANGYFVVLDDKGTVVHTDAYTQRIYTATVGWGTPATATPLADFRAVQLYSRGYSVSFGSDATAWMNRTTYNQMLANTNATDLAGRRTNGLATVLSPSDLNTVLMAEGLPSVRVYDGTYKDENGVNQLYIPNSKVIVVGRREDGAAIGDYAMTRNVNNPGAAPGGYDKVIDKVDEVPRKIEVHRGHNGGPRIYFPSAVVVMNV